MEKQIIDIEFEDGMNIIGQIIKDLGTRLSSSYT